jgi:hypothetical protein
LTGRAWQLSAHFYLYGLQACLLRALVQSIVSDECLCFCNSSRPPRAIVEYGKDDRVLIALLQRRIP